jgi:hypothetical protein
LINWRLIRTACYVLDGVHDLLVIPDGGKLGLAGVADAMPMATPAGRVAVEDVRGSFRSDADSVQRRTLPGIYRVPAGTIRSRVCWRVRSRLRGRALVVTPLNWLAVCGAQCLEVLLAGPRFGQFRPVGRRVSIARTASEVLSLVWPVHAVVVPV